MNPIGALVKSILPLDEMHHFPNPDTISSSNNCSLIKIERIEGQHINATSIKRIHTLLYGVFGVMRASSNLR